MFLHAHCSMSIRPHWSWTPRVTVFRRDLTRRSQNPAITGWNHTRIIQFGEWWPISSDNSLGKRAETNLCTRLICQPLPFSARWRHQLQCTVMTTRKRVKGKMPRPHPILVGRERLKVLRTCNSQKVVICPTVRTRQGTPCKNSPLMVIPLCFLKPWCDGKSHLERQRKGTPQAQGQLQEVQVMSVLNESACRRSIITTEICPFGPPRQALS